MATQHTPSPDSRVTETPVEGLYGDARAIEAVLTVPRGGGAPEAVAVVCHPHPLHQGTMQNKVVHTLARTFAQHGIPALRFNFRGVGGSDGVHDEGRGEADDVSIVADWLAGRYPGTGIWLSGFSFGAFVALQAATSRSPHALLTVAPAVMRQTYDGLTVPACPWLIIHGEQDEIVPVAEVVAWADGLTPRPSLTVIPAASHFFHGKLTELRERVAAFIVEQSGKD